MAGTFTPPVEPAPGSGRTTTFDVTETQYGDGYTQRGSRGINAERDAVSLEWPVLSHADADTIEAFFRQQKGWDWFDYAVPPDSQSKRWTCKTWTRSEPAPVMSSISAEFRQEFDHA